MKRWRIQKKSCLIFAPYYLLSNLEETTEAKATTANKKKVYWVRVPINVVSVAVVTVDNTVRIMFFGLGIICLL
jgi:hypothetical protein